MRLLDKNIGILVVDPVTGVVSTVKRVMQELGYKNVFQADSVQDGLNTLTTQKIDWIITSLFGSDKLTGWHFLRLPIEFDSYRTTMSSVLLNADENEMVPTLFALGMVTCHVRPITYNSFRAEMERFLQRLKAENQLQQAISADLRDYIAARNNVDEMERFELALYKWGDGSAAQKLRLVQAQLKAGNNLEALLGMKQLLSSHPECASSVSDLSQKFLGIEDVMAYKTQLNVQHVLLLDSDEAQQRFVSECLKELGVKTVTCLAEAEEACTFIKNNSSVELVICEWKLRGMEGRGFAQFIKQSGLADRPLIVFSALVGESDVKLIQEIGGIFVIKKPLAKKAFKEEINDIFSRWRYPLEGEDIEQKIYIALQGGDLDYARQLFVQFQSLEQVDRQRKVTLKAAFAYHEGDYVTAKATIIEASRIKLPSHREIGLLGKILLKLGDFADAQRCLDQANQMVPGNVERLCHMADASAALGKSEETWQHLDEAKGLAGETLLVRSTVARHATASGRPEQLAGLMGDEDVARGVVAHMNNLGVAFACAGRWKESVDAYTKALKALGQQHDDLQGAVCYNLGLSLVKQGRNKEALPVLRNAQKKAGYLVAKKASRLQEKVVHAIDTLSTVQLRERETPREINATVSRAGGGGQPLSALEEYLEVQTAVRAGELGLFRIYVPSKAMELDFSAEFPKMIKRGA